MYPTGDKYQSDKSSSRCPLGYLNKYTSDTRISMCPTGDPYKNKSTISRRSEFYKYKIRIRLHLL